LKTFELKPKKNLKSGVYTIALVKSPANERGLGIHLSKQTVSNIKLASNDGGHFIYASALVPEQRISRVDENGEEYQIFFSKETIARTARDFIKAGSLVSKFNSEHNEFETLGGVSVTMSWIVGDPKKDLSTQKGLSTVEGEWCLEIEVDNEDVARDIKLGVYEGISIEGYFENFEAVLTKQSITKSINKPNQTIMNKLNALHNVVNFLKGEVKLSEEAPKAEKLMMLEDGEYTLDNGQKIRVIEGMVEVMEVVEEEELQTPELAKPELTAEDTTAVEALAEATKEGLEAVNKKVDEKVTAIETTVTEMKAMLTKLSETPAGVEVTKLEALPEVKLENNAKFKFN